MLNQHQPIRPRYSLDEEIILLYRTFPNVTPQMMRITTQASMVAQARIYRAVANGDIPNHFNPGEVQKFLFENNGEKISKRTVGGVLCQTVIYNPRKTKTVPILNKSVSLYSFNHMDELLFGLEWMICVWLRKFLNDHAAPGEPPIFGPEMMEEELNMMVSSDDRTFEEVYIQPLWNYTNITEPDWETLVKGQVEDIPRPRKEKPRERFKRPISYE